MIDCHVHSDFSGDSDMKQDDACIAAINLGLKGIAFTDHFDHDFPNYSMEFLIDFDSYSEYVDRIKMKYSSQLKIIKGIEIGIQQHVLNESREVVKTYDFDYVIGSVHIIDGKDPYDHDFYNNKTKQYCYQKYLEDVMFMVINFDDYDVCGHIDYIIRKACYDDKTLRYNDYSDLIDSIFRKLISDGKGIEINTASYRKDRWKTNAPCFDIRLLERYRELGGEIICLGSDAHSPEYIGYAFKYFNQLLIEAGFKYTTHYENRKPIFTSIKV